ncbi:MAG: translation initiation factor IF-2, partial [Bacteroidota bacterium]
TDKPFPKEQEKIAEETKPPVKEPESLQKEESDISKPVVEKKQQEEKTGKTADGKDNSEEKPEKQKQPPIEEKQIPAGQTSQKHETLKTESGKEQPSVRKDESSDKKFIKTEVKKLEGVTILGKIDLPAAKDKTKKQPVASSSDTDKTKRRKRKRIRKDKPQDQQKTDAASRQKKEAQKSTDKKDQKKQQQQKSDKHQAQQQQSQKKNLRKEAPAKQEVSDEEISRQIRETLASLSGTGKSKGAKHRRLKRDAQERQRLKEAEQAETNLKKIQVTEFVSANELASLMDVQVTEVISTCMNLGLFVSINQRLDAETITIVADEFGFEVDFISVDEQELIEEDVDDPADLQERAPIVTVMGHVDHGKTSLLDHIRHANVIAGEAGGITQHIGAYSVQQENGKMITFLDTPGHEAFTAMRARGARVTDVVIVVVAADDNVMPQTVEAINHAQAAGVPIVIAINKIDKPTANVERVKQELANINILVEDWGGKYQSQEISAKNGVNIDLLLEKVLLESELLDLKANPKKPASGTVIESSLDKGRGYLATILVQNGRLKMGDIVVAGNTHGRVKAMFNERNQRITEAGPSTPAMLLGLDGAPQAGDNFNVVKDEQEAKAITSKRQQLIREQGLRTQKHITLDEIGRRIAIGDFKELNIIIKGDVDGSVEALADSMLKLSTEEVQVNIIHKAVGSITEGDVLLASASNAIIVGFQVRPSLAARKLAENEEIDIRLYSVIYNAINEIKSAIEGMLSPEIEEKIVANLEVREVFKISKVGTVAGCIVLDGKINRNSNIRVIRDGIVVYTGYLGSLKRFKEDVKEVSSGYECGLNVDRFNDIKKGDIIEAFETIEVARKLD